MMRITRSSMIARTTNVPMVTSSVCSNANQVPADLQDMACALGKELAAFLLEEHAAVDVQVRPAEKHAPCCPKCQQAGARVLERNKNLAQRELLTRAGQVTLRREQWQCKKCRILFFS